MSNQEGRLNVVLGLWEVYPPYFWRVNARPLSERAYRPEADSQAQLREDYLYCDSDYPSEIFFKVI
jgi:hypothetical protein